MKDTGHSIILKPMRYIHVIFVYLVSRVIQLEVVMFMLCGCFVVSFKKWKLLKYTLPVFVYSLLSNIPKFFELEIDIDPFDGGRYR